MNAAEALERTDTLAIHGRVAQAVGIVIEGYGPVTSIGEMCEITRENGLASVPAEVVGFRGDRILLMPLGDTRGIGPDSRLIMKGHPGEVPVGPQLLGRILNGLGEPIDGRGPIAGDQTYPLHAMPPDPLQRSRIVQPLDLGVRAINGLLTCGIGQRMGIFATSGVGKSVLLGMIGRYTTADVNVIALIGERGREVKEFLERDLTPQALARSIVVVATSDQPPLVRIRGALLATTISEYFRDCGKQVLLMMDSLTRLAYGQREIGLATGEPPTTKGYTPSVFALLPKLLERVGTGRGTGSITGLYTVLVDGDELSDPIAESARSILDGHIVLSRDLAARNHFPAIDILGSASRVMRDIIPAEQYAAARRIVELTAIYRRSEDLITLGAYKPGANKRLDQAVAASEAVNEFLRQDAGMPSDWTGSVDALMKLEQATR
ncbi:flagellum-specific ATP synthase [Nitrospira sp. KM1]|uniref:FliI/YscN family ATPase n=1 Tax=Nitrospira sp. KM1 TaxID=1936990 RepID=UPI0013A714A4|nr:FliI/YscN family ATPase [Nitrospira sp. KM1]BCA54815.1 flagellum-specific ATP synthase [Nitrospira sp. KM1]